MNKYYDIIKPYTMTSEERIDNLYNLVKEINEKNIKGNLVECGVWKCGMLGLMKLTNDEYEGDRKIFGFDSFEGLPAPDISVDGDGAKEWEGSLKISIEEAQKNLENMNASEVILYKGFFEETIQRNLDSLEDIAILRLDGDWYSSTMYCLENLYDKVSSGGFIIVDDYGHWEGCKKAVDEFIKTKNLDIKLNVTDYTEVWWQKA